MVFFTSIGPWQTYQYHLVPHLYIFQSVWKHFRISIRFAMSVGSFCGCLNLHSDHLLLTWENHPAFTKTCHKKNEVQTQKQKDCRKGLACFFKGHNVHPPSGSPLCWVRFRPVPTSCERIVVEKAWWSMPKAALCASCFREKQMRAQVEKREWEKARSHESWRFAWCRNIMLWHMDTLEVLKVEFDGLVFWFVLQWPFLEESAMALLGRVRGLHLD